MTGDELDLLEDGAEIRSVKQHVVTRCNVLGYQTRRSDKEIRQGDQTRRSDKERQEVVITEALTW
jgi:hypothetical protein